MKNGMSVCPGCGAKNRTKDAFCVKCGSQLKLNVENEENRESKKKKGKGLVIVLGLLAVLIVAFIIYGNKNTRIRLNDYVSVSFEGYDGYGSATAKIEWDKVQKDYEGKLRGKAATTGVFDMLVLFAKGGSLVEGELTKDMQLTNGEKVIFSWDVDDEEVKENYGVEFVYSDIELEVSGLKDIEEVDPFEGLNVYFYGISPLGEASIEGMAETYGNSLFFELDERRGLANGDIVTLRAEYTEGEEQLANRQGVKLIATEKQFTVEGLDEYVTSVEEIDEELLENMISEGKDEYMADAAGWVDGQKIDEMTYIGNYFLYAKNQEEAECHNRVCVVYKVVASDNYPKTGQVGSFEFYVAVNFDNVINTAGGESLVDLEKCYYTWGTFTRTVDTGEYYWDQTLYYDGFQDIDTLFRKSVIAYGDDYMYEGGVEM